MDVLVLLFLDAAQQKALGHKYLSLKPYAKLALFKSFY